MNVTELPITRKVRLPVMEATACPYDESEAGKSCAASIMTVTTNIFQKKTYCWTDNYDCCPLFLAKVLRGN